MSGNGFLKEYKFHNEYCTFRALSSVVFVCDTRKRKQYTECISMF